MKKTALLGVLLVLSVALPLTSMAQDYRVPTIEYIYLAPLVNNSIQNPAGFPEGEHTICSVDGPAGLLELRVNIIIQGPSPLSDSTRFILDFDGTSFVDNEYKYVPTIPWVNHSASEEEFSFVFTPRIPIAFNSKLEVKFYSDGSPGAPTHAHCTALIGK
jgi:hypothetical protein